MTAWRGWIHCNGNTYGSWLRGDRRGWRSRHHREHCVGDYRNPPAPGAYDGLLRQSVTGMRQAGRTKVLLAPPARAVAARVMGEALLWHEVELIDLCVDRVHFHVLARFAPVDGRPLRAGVSADRSWRHLVGIAKKRAARALSDLGLVPVGGVWGKRSGARPLRDRAHQVAVARYIPEHARKGAVVWSTLRRRGLLDVPLQQLVEIARTWRL